MKRLPTQTDMQIRDRLKTLKYFPSQTKREWTTFVAHLMCLPKQTKAEASALVEHIKHLSELRGAEVNSIVMRMNELSQSSTMQSEALVEEIERLPIAQDIKEGMISFVKRITLNEHAQFADKIKNLEKSSQEELTVLVDLIKKHIQNPAMIIIFGSYAKGEGGYI